MQTAGGKPLSDGIDAKADASAEKAYAHASEATVSEKTAKPTEPVAPAEAQSSVKAPAKPKTPAKPKPTAKARAKAVPKPKRATKAPAKKKITSSKSLTISKLKTKEPTMAKSEKIVEDFQGFMADAQSKAQEAFEKSTGMFGDYTEFAKGNAEAVVESGKILVEGLQDFGTNLAAEGRSAFETVSGDMKDLAAAKNPSDFLKAQSEMARKNFDNAVAYGSKNTEALLKLASDVMAPISGRVSVAVEKARDIAS